MFVGWCYIHHTKIKYLTPIFLNFSLLKNIKLFISYLKIKRSPSFTYFQVLNATLHQSPSSFFIVHHSMPIHPSTCIKRHFPPYILWGILIKTSNKSEKISYNFKHYNSRFKSLIREKWNKLIEQYWYLNYKTN